MHTPPLILIVDDEKPFAEIMSTKLIAAGYQTAVAHTDQDAIRLASELEPDLILMDIYMPPGPTGTDVALTIKQQPRTKDVRIAFLSSLDQPWHGVTEKDRESLTRALGMETFLDKGEDLEVLLAKVKALLPAA